MYVNIKILAAFPWFQALNILVILSLTVRRQQWLYRTTSDALHKKASWIPKPSVLSNIPRSALRFTASGASKASLALLFTTRTPHFRLQGETGRDTGIGLDMYVVFTRTPHCCVLSTLVTVKGHWTSSPGPGMAAVWLLLVGGWCFQPHLLPWLGACLLLDQAPCSGQWEGNKQHEDIILAIYPLFLWYFPKFSNQ